MDIALSPTPNGACCTCKDHQGMWRSVKSNGLSDIADLSWAKDAVLARAVGSLPTKLQIPPQNAK